MDSKTFLKNLKTVNGQLATIKTEMSAMQTGFEPPPDPDKPGLLDQLSTIQAYLSSIGAIATTLINDINSSP